MQTAMHLLIVVEAVDAKSRHDVGPPQAPQAKAVLSVELQNG